MKKPIKPSAKKSQFWSLVFSKRTIVTVLATLAVLGAIKGVGHVVCHFKYKNMTVEQRMEKKATWKVDRWAKKLDMTDDQKTQMMAMMMANANAKKQERQERMTKMDADMKAILTPEQYQKWAAKMEKKAKRYKDKM